MASVSSDHSVSTSNQVARHSHLWRPKDSPEVELLYGSYRNFQFCPHFHEVAAIGVVDQGTMTCYWEGDEYQVPTNTVILFNAGDVHAPRSRTSQPWSFRMFYLDPALATALLAHDRPFTRPFIQDVDLARAVVQTHRSFQHGNSALESESLLAHLAGCLGPHTYRKRHSLSLVENAKLVKVRDYIRTHYAQNVTLHRLATEAELSPFHLVRSFRMRFGIPPHLYLMQQRVEQARILLRSGFPIAETAMQTGFVDQSHFTRHFKRFTGVTPGQYR